ncbi:MAG TPA: STAS domain-containing protein [Solirubrobacterales bacterium]|nr:STAS domain-containing protein [Solirubrobacterales bacterium]
MESNSELHQSKVRAGMLSIRSERNGTIHRIALEGELDLANADKLETALDAALAGSRRVVLDMAALTFIDSTGIALLVAALGHEGSEDRLRFVPSQSLAVTRVLEITGVDSRLPCADGASL